MDRRGLIHRAVGLCLVAGTLGACGPKLDPLADLKAELAAAGASEPQATVVVDDAALSAMAAELLGRPYTAPGPLGIAVVVIPDIERADVRILPGADGSVVAEVEVDGSIDVAFPLASQDDIAFEGKLTAPVTPEVRPDPQGSWLLLRWTAGAGVATEVALPGAPAQLEALTSGLVQGALAGALAEPRGALVPSTPWGPVRAVALDARDGDLLAHVTVQGPPGAQPEPVAPADGGFAVVLSEASVLGLLQGLAVTGQEAESYVVEPLSVSFGDDEAAAELVVHKRARREKWRRYRVSGPLVWDAGRIAVTDPQLELLEAHGWRRGLSVTIGENRAITALDQGIGGLPTALAQPLTTDLAMHLEVERVEAADGRLVVAGPVTVTARRSP